MTETPTTAPAAPPPLDINLQDAAWVRVPTTLAPEALSALLADTAVLLRLNPYYYFKTWRQVAPDRLEVAFENQSNNQSLTTGITATPGPGSGMTLAYDTGLKRRTFFSVETTDGGSTLVITDDYGGWTEEERKQRENEIDKSLLAWGEAFRVYLLRIQRYSRIPGWRWYMRRVWMPMKPSARRIVWLLYLITVVEFAFFLFVLLIWVIEKSK